MANIVAIRVFRLWETCQRTTYYVELRTDEGFTHTPDGHRTGDIYNDFKGLSVEEARERALSDATHWSDFLGIPVDPYVEDGTTYEAEWKRNSYTMQREIARRRKDK